MAAYPVIILGAGASNDVVDTRYTTVNEQKQPPLCNQLFDNRFSPYLTKYKKLSNIVGELRAKVSRRESLEDILWEINEISKKLPHRAEQIKELQYYLQEIFYYFIKDYVSTGSNYGTLISKLRDIVPEACFVTFNYDLLLDKALEESFDISFTRSYHYTHFPYKLIKVHGSCNWVISDPEMPFDGLQVVQNPNSTTYPLISIPLAKGKTFSCPDAHLQHLERALDRATDLIFIGWKGKEDHFIKNFLEVHLAGKRLNFTVVTKNEESAKKIREDFQFIESTGDPMELVFGGGFSGFINSPACSKVLERMIS